MPKAVAETGALKPESKDYRLRLKEARLLKGLNQQSLADLIGVTKTSVSRIEQLHDHVNVPKLQAICDALNVRLVWVISGEGVMLTRVGKTELTKDVIARMPAGPELDALVAEVIYGDKDALEGGMPSFRMDFAWSIHLRMCDKPASIRKLYFSTLAEAAGVAWPEVLVALRDDFPLQICRAACRAVLF